MKVISHLVRFSVAAVLTASAFAAHAQSVEEFYKKKPITLLVYSGAGSSYDFYARLLSRHLGAHMPGKPNIIVQNMVGAGGYKLVDYLNRIAPRDGSVIATVTRGLPFDPMLGKTEIPFEPLEFTWLGSMNREIAVALSWNTSKIKTFADLQKSELIVPGTGVGADSEIIPRAYNVLAGTKFKIIAGYRDTAEAALQMETGELAGIGYWSWSAIAGGHPDWPRDKKINVLFHTGLEEVPGVAGVPRIRDLVTDPTDKKALEFLLAREIIGRPYLAPPGVPADRAKALRDGFNATMKSKDFIADAQRSNIEVHLVTAKEVEDVIREAAQSPQPVIDRVKEILGR